MDFQLFIIFTDQENFERTYSLLLALVYKSYWIYFFICTLLRKHISCVMHVIALYCLKD